MKLILIGVFGLAQIALIKASISEPTVLDEILDRQATINCGSLQPVYVPTNMQGRVNSPNYPYYYPASSYCIWVMETDANSKFVVTCDPMSISCNDYVQISPTGDTTFQSAYVAQCGYGPIYFNSTTNRVAIRFYSYAYTNSGYLQCVAVSTPVSPPTTTTQPPTTTTRPPTTTTRPPTTTTQPPTTTTRPPTTTTRASTTITASTTPTPCKCGVKGASRIVGGQRAGDYEWPWQAMLVDLKDNGNQYCGGTLIDANWVITAAHCIDTKTTSDIAVIVGQNNTRDLTPTGQVRNVSRIFKHPLFNSTTVDNDIALLQLVAPVAYTQAVQPICLPFKYPGYEFTKQVGTVTGWGTTSYGGISSTSLLEVTLPILNTTECRTYTAIAKAVTDNMICTYADNKDACQGDSGGPLNWQEPSSGLVHLAGIVSFGIGCARPQTPGTYVKVTKYLNWIKTTTNAQFCSP